MCFCFVFLRLILEQPNLFPFFLSQDRHHIYFTWSTSTVWSMGLTGINICVDCLEKAIWKNSLTAWKWIGSLRSVWPGLFSIMFVWEIEENIIYFFGLACGTVCYIIRSVIHSRTIHRLPRWYLLRRNGIKCLSFHFSFHYKFASGILIVRKYFLIQILQ